MFDQFLYLTWLKEITIFETASRLDVSGISICFRLFLFAGLTYPPSKTQTFGSRKFSSSASGMYDIDFEKEVHSIAGFVSLDIGSC